MSQQQAAYKADVFIAGGGPIGATLAKYFIDAGYKVIIAELGAADSFNFTKDKNGNEICVPGAHKKNEIEYQKDIDRFVNVIRGALSPVSVPVRGFTDDTLDPSAWNADGSQPPVTNGKNPCQDVNENLSAEAVTHVVGGMSTHWTCATPRFNEDIERPTLIENKEDNKAEWERLYTAAEDIIGTNSDAFDQSIRHTLVLRTLQDAYRSRTFKPIPLACHRLPNPEYVYWHAADRIYEHIYNDPAKKANFTLLTNTRCTNFELVDDPSTNKKVRLAKLKNFLADAHTPENDVFYVDAKYFIVAAGAVATPQILFKTDMQVNKNPNKPLFPNLGKYITEQPLSFCQVILKKELIDLIPTNPYKLDWWKEKVEKQQKNHPEDPLQFPYTDPEPQVTSPFTKEKPWHTQIHRDAFSYGDVAATLDTRTIVDLRFFGYVEPNEKNTITFEKGYTDAYGMPQPTFTFNMGVDDNKRAHAMMTDMCDVASKLGGYLPGSAPQFMSRGLALHLGGTVRAGLDKNTHVADTYCKVYDFDNLYVAGNGVIPTGFGANPTLTSIGYAIRTAENIIGKLKAGSK
ncbi:hypothetical protein VNI00_009621 [Paramarasmius palmivorus]|uniref:Pyranose 2-oxidase n=1 Tax=Paramarasmius palmivorus TaxID=297713 RepID=A0AAW0CM11_9AGAR